MESIHKRLKRLRLAKGVSLQEVGVALGIAWQTVQQWERDTKKGTAPKRERQEAVADYYGVSVSYLLTGQDYDSSFVNTPVDTPSGKNELSEARGKKDKTEREKLIDQINEVIRQTDDPGLEGLLEHAKICAKQFPVVKQTPKSS